MASELIPIENRLLNLQLTLRGIHSSAHAERDVTGAQWFAAHLRKLLDSGVECSLCEWERLADKTDEHIDMLIDRYY